MALVKGMFYNADSGQAVVTCHFNPSDLKMNRKNNWQPPAANSANPNELHFGGSDPQTLDMDLWFDTYTAGSDVRQVTNKLLSLMQAPAPTQSNQHPRPPHVFFRWGTFSSFRAVITSANQTFTLFLPSGTPVRAMVKVTLQEVLVAQTGQNPTSRAAGARRVHVVQAGDTIDWIATQELGDPTAWRALAEANGLDDPRRLQEGQALFIPSDI
jgi:nucleoid-associated protein YgaU